MIIAIIILVITNVLTLVGLWYRGVVIFNLSALLKAIDNGVYFIKHDDRIVQVLYKEISNEEYERLVHKK